MKYLLTLNLIIIPLSLSTKHTVVINYTVFYEKQQVTSINKYEKLANFIKSHEGLMLTPYYCPGNFLTIGYGHSIKKGERLLSITKNQADSILMQDIKLAEKFVRSNTNLEGNKLLAITHFVFCVGSGNFIKSSLYQDIKNNRDIEQNLMKWCFIKGKFNNNLKNQRLFELQLYKSN